MKPDAAAGSDAAAAPLDVVCIGRAAVDLYGEQIGARLEDVTTFARYLGGSPANTAIGCARLGLRAAMLTRVGDEQNGSFVLQALAREGVDTSQVRRDPQRLTALVFLSLRSRSEFPLLFYRDRCADMALAEDDVDPAFIAGAQAVLISGTHLSQPGTAAACRKAVAAARAAGRKVVLDIDYRPVLWGLRPLGDGATRYVPAEAVSATLQALLPQCDLVVGTDEEIRLAGGHTDTAAALRNLRALTDAVIVVKHGEDGCEVHAAGEPPVREPGFPVEVFNVLGAGDAFMAGFLSGWLRRLPLAECARRANACGALVVSRHGCAPAIPTATELDHFLRHGSGHRRLRDDAALNHLHRASTRAPAPQRLAVIAFDHRTQFEELAAQTGAGAADIERFKRLIAQAAEQVARESGGHAPDGALACGLIVDDRYGADLLPELDEAGWWLARPVEAPGSRPLRFEGGNIASTLRRWPVRHVAKCLVAFDADDPAELRAAQLDALRDLAQACAETQRELLLEVIPPGREPESGRLRDSDETLTRALAAITGAGILPDWWKLPPPARASTWTRWREVIAGADAHCRGVLLLGFDAPLAELGAQIAAAKAQPLCRGFAVGRTIFGEAARAWFERRIDDAAAVESIAGRYRQLLQCGAQPLAAAF